MITHCLNCGTELSTGPYCGQCGQRNVHSRLVFSDLLSDIRTQLLEWHLPWLFTIREMAYRPGDVCRDYMEGMRKRYVNPVKYLAYVASVMLILLNLLPQRYSLLPATRPGESGYFTFETSSPVFSILLNNPLLIIALLAPLAALVFRLLYSTVKFNNTELSCFVLYTLANCILLATGLHLAGEALFAFMGIDPLNLSYAERYLEPKYWLILGTLFGYIVLTASGFFREVWYLTWIKVMVIMVLYMFAFGATFGFLVDTSDAELNLLNEEPIQDGSRELLTGPSSWAERERFLQLNIDNPERGGFQTTSKLSYGQLLMAVGRSEDALYYLLLASAEVSPNAAYPSYVASSLAQVYLQLGQPQYALTQIERISPPPGTTPNGALMRERRLLEEAMQRGDKTRLLEIARRQGLVAEYDTTLAQWWVDGNTEAMFAEIRKVADAPNSTNAQLAHGASWAVLLGDARLAWSLFQEMEDKNSLWLTIWMPYFSEVRKLNAFKDFVRDEGLLEYWQSTGNWADKCRPLGDDDFECF